MAECLLDLDGVLVDFVEGAARLHGRDPATVDCWDFMDKWGIPAPEFWAPMGEEFWANLPPTKEFREIVELVESYFDPSNVCLLTSPCFTPGCVEGKRSWINTHIPQYRKNVLFGSAKRFCAAPHRLLIDDSERNYVEFVAAGGLAILVPRPWNSRSGDAAVPRLRADLAALETAFVGPSELGCLVNVAHEESNAVA